MSLQDLKNTTIPVVFQSQAQKYGNRVCVQYKDSIDKKYRDLSWSAMNDMVHKIGWYLLSLGVKKGDRVAVFSANRPEWWIADLAILSIGAINVPIYSTNSVEETHYVIDHSGAIICFCGSEDQMEKTLKAKKKLPKLKKIVVFDDVQIKKREVATFADAMKSGEAYNKKGDFEKRLKAVKPKDLATIMYTSGTTGNPKGVMLSHDNFISDVRQILNDFKEYIHDGHRLLSLLPLSHSFERTAGYYMPMCAGCSVAFAEDFSTLLADLQAIRPSFMVSVPRVYEKIHSTILTRLPEASSAKQFMFKMATKTAAKNLPYECNGWKRKGLFALQYNLFDKLVYSKIKEALGMDKISYIVSGGAPLSVSDAEFFIGMGLRILEGFGLTETTPVTNVNTPWKIKPGTIGPALSETKEKISDEGELLIKGPQVMQGYYKNKKATEEAFTKDGWFRTGDMAVIDNEGYVAITGRIKDIIVTAGGKNISPQNIENSLKESIYIEQVAIIGDRRKYLSALVIPAFEGLTTWAKRNGISYTDYNDLVKNKSIIGLIGSEIEKYTKQFARVEQIRKFSLLDAEWTQDTGELTPSLKVKRRVIETKYQDAIEAMYPPE